MSRIILAGLMAAVSIPTVAAAQSNGELRRDRENVQEQRDDLRDARQRGDRRDVREEREDLRDAREELREDRSDRRRSQYRAPYRNWRYSTIRPGFQLRSAFYGSRYYIAEPGRYGLQRTARNHRWIRYGDDLVLVNLRNGRVLQVMPSRY
jgi:Ni/Co efflux regulator RcnB